jgi:hypothetical protein
VHFPPPLPVCPPLLALLLPSPLFSFTSLVCECVVYLLLRECANPTLASDSLTRHRYPPPCGCVACCVLLRLAFVCSYFLLLRCNGGLWISFSFLGARFFFRFFLLFSLSLSTMHPSRVCSTVPFRESVITQGTYQTVRGGFTLMLCRLYADRGYGPYPPSFADTAHPRKCPPGRTRVDRSPRPGSKQARGVYSHPGNRGNETLQQQAPAIL